MSHVVTIAGSPSASAKTCGVLEYACRVAKRNGLQTHCLAVRDLPAEDLLHANFRSAAIQEAIAWIDQAEAVIVATPVYKTAYSGILKAFLDLLPRNALQGKTVLPVAIAGAPGHLLAIDYALRPVLAALGASHVLRGVYIAESQIQFDHGGTPHLEEDVAERLSAGIEEMATTLHRALDYSI